MNRKLKSILDFCLIEFEFCVHLIFVQMCDVERSFFPVSVLSFIVSNWLTIASISFIDVRNVMLIWCANTNWVLGFAFLFLFYFLFLINISRFLFQFICCLLVESQQTFSLVTFWCIVWLKEMAAPHNIRRDETTKTLLRNRMKVKLN